ncbi:hypothetical protein ACFYWS_18570 [Streptomyces sp. NPDC002795]|uniref:hypothetical protein n=1 Tax=Streptomyces sp. NPDC002795 TaxID=3364665 RepID=UPI00368D5113
MTADGFEVRQDVLDQIVQRNIRPPNMASERSAPRNNLTFHEHLGLPNDRVLAMATTDAARALSLHGTVTRSWISGRCSPSRP